MTNIMNVKRGDIFFADLSKSVGSEQGGLRPVLIVQNNVGNKFSPTTIVASITTKSKKKMPTHVIIHKSSINGLDSDSIIMFEQIKSIDKRMIKNKIGTLEDFYMRKVNEAMKISLDL